MKDYELFIRFPFFKTRAVTLSFDDGSIEDRKMVEILNRYGMKCTFNLNSGIIEGDLVTGSVYLEKVQFDEIRELYRGHEVAVHSYTHPYFENLDRSGIIYQIMKDREVLEEFTGKIIQGFAYPFGVCEREGVMDCIGDCGIKYGRTTSSTHRFDLPRDYLRWNPTCHHSDERMSALTEEFLMSDDTRYPKRIRPLLFYIWGHSYEYKNCWEKLEELCRTLGGKENVWYATNGEIIDYLCAYKALRHSAKGKIVYNPTDTDIFVFADGKNIVLKKGETTVIG